MVCLPWLADKIYEKYTIIFKGFNSQINLVLSQASWHVKQNWNMNIRSWEQRDLSNWNCYRSSVIKYKHTDNNRLPKTPVFVLKWHYNLKIVLFHEANVNLVFELLSVLVQFGEHPQFKFIIGDTLSLYLIVKSSFIIYSHRSVQSSTHNIQILECLKTCIL